MSRALCTGVIVYTYNIYTTQKQLRIFNILNFFLYFIYRYAMCARHRIAYINYTKKLRIFNILNFFCVVYVTYSHMLCVFTTQSPLLSWEPNSLTGEEPLHAPSRV